MAFFLITSQAVTPTNKPFERRSVEFEPDNGKSYLGTLVYSYLEFPEGKYETLSGDIISFDGCRINEVLLEVSMSKNIVTTAIQGKNGTIKEYVSDGDYEVSVTGRIVNQNNALPEIALNALKEICKVPDSLNVNCPFLQYFDITACVITDYSFIEIEGTRNMIDFTMSLLSDVPPIDTVFGSGEFSNDTSPLTTNTL